jgi:hypothetical protein
MPLSVEDRLAIQDLLCLYAHFHDSKQPHRIPEEIFTADAVIDFGTGPLAGRDAIGAFFAGFAGLLGTSHNITNIIIDGDGDRARAQCHCLAWHWLERPEVDGRPSIHPCDFLAVGGYQDLLIRGAEGWRISNRKTVQYGTGLGVGDAEPARAVLEGGLGRLPDWP